MRVATRYYCVDPNLIEVRLEGGIPASRELEIVGGATHTPLLANQWPTVIHYTSGFVTRRIQKIGMMCLIVS